MAAMNNDTRTPARQLGTVKWFSKAKGYGFIVADSIALTGGKDVYVHYKDIRGQTGSRNLEEGDRVEFDLVDEGRGPKALRVRRIDE